MTIDILQLGIILGVILVSMTLHEVMHGFISYWLGDDTAKLQGRLTLNPIKHIDPFLTIVLPILLAITGAPIFGGAKPVPFNPERIRGEEWGVAAVAIAGPLTNLLLAFVAFGALVLSGLVTQQGIVGDGGIVGVILLYFVYINIGFFVFNMLPIPPLDGSRVLYALAPDFVRRGMEFIEPYALFVVFAIVLFANNALGAFMGGAIQFFTDVFSRLFIGI